MVKSYYQVSWQRSIVFNAGAFSGSAQAKLDEHLFSKDPGLTFDVISDIQGDLNDFKHVLNDMKQVNPASKALIVNGDITDRGWDFEYQAVQQVLDHNPHPDNVWYSIGNHEFYKPKWATPNKLAQNTWPNHTPESEMLQNFITLLARRKSTIKRARRISVPFLRNRKIYALS